jgi:hypothetical protein
MTPAQWEGRSCAAFSCVCFFVFSVLRASFSPLAMKFSSPSRLTTRNSRFPSLSLEKMQPHRAQDRLRRRLPAGLDPSPFPAADCQCAADPAPRRRLEAAREGRGARGQEGPRGRRGRRRGRCRHLDDRGRRRGAAGLERRWRRRGEKCTRDDSWSFFLFFCGGRARETVFLLPFLLGGIESAERVLKRKREAERERQKSFLLFSVLLSL